MPVAVSIICLVFLQVLKCFGPVQFFCARPKIYLHIVAVTNISCQTKRWFAFSKIGFCAGTKGFEKALNAVKFLGWLQKFGPAQNILGPVKGQGTNGFNFSCHIFNAGFFLSFCHEIKKMKISKVAAPCRFSSLERKITWLGRAKQAEWAGWAYVLNFCIPNTCFESTFFWECQNVLDWTFHSEHF